MFSNRVRRIQASIIGVTVLLCAVWGGLAAHLWQETGVLISMPVTVLFMLTVGSIVLLWGSKRGGW